MRSSFVRGLCRCAAAFLVLNAGWVIPGANAQIPPLIPFQGRVTVSDVAFQGNGAFKFAFIAIQGAPPTEVTVWSHDGSGLGGLTEPATTVSLNVNRGLYSVLLGDTNVPNMTVAIPATVFTNDEVRLRVWFSDGVHGVQRLIPDQRIATVGYAFAADHAATARLADGLAENPTFSGLSTFAGAVVMGAVGSTERLNVAGNIQLANDGSIFGLDRLVGFNDLRLYGDALGGPDLYIGTDGRVGFGTTVLGSQVSISGPDNNGTVAGLQIDSGTQRLLLDGNEIDSNGALHLNFNGPYDITLANGGGRVSVGPIVATERLNVDGNIKLANNSDIIGIDDLIGYDGLELWGDNNGAADFTIGTAGNMGQRALYGNVTFNIRGDFVLGETQYLRVEDLFGSILEVQSDRDVAVNGDFFVVNGSKDFAIDHPQAPAEKVLRHNTVEGPGYYTFYHGRALLDAKGEAWVTLPGYFDVLNTAPQYQLTCVGGYAPVYVAEEVSNNRFKIAGGKEGLQVCWQVTAARNDPFARDHPYKAEIEKPPEERGRYYYPEGYGAKAEQAISRRDAR